MKAASYLLLIQGLYWLFIGLWGMINSHSLERVTNIMVTDIWLVKTVSILIIVISLSLLSGVKSKEQTMPVILLAITGCIGLAGIDFYYSETRVISPAYLMDGIVQILFFIAWIVVLLISRNKKQASLHSNF